MTAGRESVALVTVTYNSAGVLEDFLDSVASQQDVDLHLYAVDNDSADESRAMLRSAAESLPLTLIESPTNEGVAAGNNRGSAAALRAGYEWVVLINNDTFFAPHAVADLVAEARRLGARVLSPYLEATDPGGSAWYVGGDITMWKGARASHDHIHRPMAELDPTPHVTRYAPTCVLLVHRTVFDDVGAMDASYFVYGDDLDFALRARKAGIDYWVSGNVLFSHKVSAITGPETGPFSARWMTRNWVLAARKHCSTAQLLTGIPYVFAWILGRFLLRREPWATFRIRMAAALEGLRAELESPGPLDLANAAPTSPPTES